MSNSKQKGMGRAEKIRRRALRKRRDQLKEMKRDLHRMKAEGPIEAGMSRREALNLIAKGAEEIMQRTTAEGLASRLPWGVAVDQRVCIQTMKDGLSELERRLELMDSIDEDTAAEGELAHALAGIIGPAITVGAAAVLFLGSSPIPFDMAKHLLVDESASRLD